MHYTYTAAWSVIGGISLLDDAGEIELYRSEDFRFVLTRAPDSLLANLDRGLGIRRLLTKALTGQQDDAPFAARLAVEMGSIAKERAAKVGSFPVLVYEAGGETGVKPAKHAYEDERVVVAFDLVDEQVVARGHLAKIRAMKLAVALETDTQSRFAALGDGVCLIDEAGKFIYSISLSGSAEMITSRALLSEATGRIAARFARLNAPDMGSVQRLFSQMVAYKTDPLRAFLSGWSALEILVEKTFKSYEQAFLSPLTSAGQPVLRERFLVRVREVMRDKYRLVDKFTAVAAVLLPTAPASEVEADFEKFKQLKARRDSISHGDEFSEEDLRVHEIATLLRKYLIARVEASDPAAT